MEGRLRFVPEERAGFDKGEVLSWFQGRVRLRSEPLLLVGVSRLSPRGDSATEASLGLAEGIWLKVSKKRFFGRPLWFLVDPSSGLATFW